MPFNFSYISENRLSGYQKYMLSGRADVVRRDLFLKRQL